MDMKKFLEQYTTNLLNTLKEHGYGVDSINWECALCPLREQCHKDSEEHPEENITCGEFIKRNLTDGANYR